MSIASNLTFIESAAGAINTGTINAPGPITFSINSTESSRFSSNLNLLLGSTTDQGAYKLQVTGNAIISGALTVTTATITNLFATVSTASNLAGGSAGQVVYQGGAGLSAFSSGVTISGNNLTVVGSISAGATSYIAGAQIITTATIGSYAAAGGTSTSSNYATTSSFATTSGFANTATTIGITTASSGTYYITFVSTTTGNLSVVSDAGGNLTYNPGIGRMAIASTATSTGTNTGALVVAGGVGIGGALYVGGGFQTTGSGGSIIGASLINTGILTCLLYTSPSPRD